MKLVLVGKAIMPLPTHPDIIPAGFLSEEEKWAAISEAFAVVVPSPYESLSMSLLEAWACGKPALVNGRCAVLKAHCLRSNAGLYYENENEFFACFDFLMNHPEEARQMGLNGQAYVRANYGWEQVKAKYEQAVAWVFKPLSASVHG
jgi:glycosyltransferase involved in cell wall biosynthesis